MVSESSSRKNNKASKKGSKKVTKVSKQGATAREPSKKTPNKRFNWTAEENAVLRAAVEKHQLSIKNGKKWADWQKVTHEMKLQGFSRTEKQVRERYLNHEDPSINTSEQWTEAEREKIIELYEVMGKSWARMTTFEPLTSRTPVQIRNYYDWHIADEKPRQRRRTG